MSPRKLNLEMNGKVHEVKLGETEASFSTPPGTSAEAATLHFDANEKDLARAALQKYLELEPNGSEVDEVQALLKR